MEGKSQGQATVAMAKMEKMTEEPAGLAHLGSEVVPVVPDRVPQRLHRPTHLRTKTVMMRSLSQSHSQISQCHQSGHIAQLEKLINEEMERQKEISIAKQRKDYGIFQNDFERLLDMEARVKEARASRQRDGATAETVLIRGAHIHGGHPKFPTSRQTGQQQQQSILKELFGEDMYGAQRKYPLFTSFFDEFLPDGRYNEREEPSPEIVGGWKASTQSTITPIFSQENPFGQIFKMTMAPWIQKIYESSDPSRFDVKDRVMKRVKNDIWNDKREDNPSFEEFQKLMHEERTKAAKERMQLLVEKRQELEKMMKENREKDGKGNKQSEGATSPDSNAIERAKEGREPKTELELHDFFAELAEKNDTKTDGKRLVSESISITSTTDANGIKRTTRVSERRYSDGTVEKVEHLEDSVTNFRPFLGPLRSFNSSKDKSGDPLNHPVLRAIEEHKKQNEARPTEAKTPPTPTPTPTTTAPEAKDDDGRKDGGFGSWLWAPGNGKKKD
ncbi:hypothetical protein TWF481_011215 [Arthrobotrys musiformis]|uniref:Uncharacterized protein n=1 Tax=Arthrobotrys musiformis TaxID=47236 RepID=A0AAV9W056_9PEZI